jgi:hypothetical protein
MMELLRISKNQSQNSMTISIQDYAAEMAAIIKLTRPVRSAAQTHMHIFTSCQSSKVDWISAQMSSHDNIELILFCDNLMQFNAQCRVSFGVLLVHALHTRQRMTKLHAVRVSARSHNSRAGKNESSVVVMKDLLYAVNAWKRTRKF